MKSVKHDSLHAFESTFKSQGMISDDAELFLKPKPK